MVKKCNFLKVVKNPNRKFRFLVNLRSFFSTYKFFPVRGWLFPVSKFHARYFNEKISSIDGLKKSYSNFRKSTDFGQFWLPRATFQVNFLDVQANFQKSMVRFLGQVVGNIVLNFELSIFALLQWDGSRFASRHFPESVILARCNLVGWQFVACYACYIVILHSFQK